MGFAWDDRIFFSSDPPMMNFGEGDAQIVRCRVSVATHGGTRAAAGSGET
jgi:hypothetical protein